MNVPIGVRKGAKSDIVRFRLISDSSHTVNKMQHLVAVLNLNVNELFKEQQEIYYRGRCGWVEDKSQSLKRFLPTKPTMLATTEKKHKSKSN